MTGARATTHAPGARFEKLRARGHVSARRFAPRRRCVAFGGAERLHVQQPMLSRVCRTCARDCERRAATKTFFLAARDCRPVALASSSSRAPPSCPSSLPPPVPPLRYAASRRVRRRPLLPPPSRSPSVPTASTMMTPSQPCVAFPAAPPPAPRPTAKRPPAIRRIPAPHVQPSAVPSSTLKPAPHRSHFKRLLRCECMRSVWPDTS